MKNWAIIENDKELKEASIRFEKIRMAKKGEADYKEKMLLLLLISEYEEQKSPVLCDGTPELDFEVKKGNNVVLFCCFY